MSVKAATILSLVWFVFLSIGGAVWYGVYHHNQIVKQQQEIAAQQAAAQAQAQAQVNIQDCQKKADLPYEAVLMYDPSYDPNALAQMQQANENCQQQYGQ